MSNKQLIEALDRMEREIPAVVLRRHKASELARFLGELVFLAVLFFTLLVVVPLLAGALAQ